MVEIKNKNELRIAYSFIEDLKEFSKTGNVKNPDKLAEIIIEYKRSIREYHRNDYKDTRIIKGDYDGYVELIEFPEWADLNDAQLMFGEFHELHARPSQYDCTGQKFTTGVKFFTRNDRVYCYHSVGVDV